MNQKQKLILPHFYKEHYHTLFNIYNTLFKEYHSILDFDSFLLFALNNSSDEARHYL